MAPDGSEVCVSRKDAKGEAWQHERRALPGPRGGRRGRSASPTRPATTAAAATAPTAAPRLPHAAARGLRGRPLAARGLRPRERQRSARSPTPSTARSTRSVFSPDSKTLYFTAEDDGLSPVFSVPVAGGAVTQAARRTGHARRPRGDRATARRSSPRRRRSPTPRRSCASARTARASRASTRVNDALLAGFGLRAGESVSYTGRRRQERAGVGGAAARLRPREEVPAARAGPRRAAGRLARRLELPLERPGVRERRLRRVHAQPARIDRLGPGVHRRHQRRLGRQGVRGRDEGHRLRDDAARRRRRAASPRPARATAAT